METQTDSAAPSPLTWAIVEVMGHSSYGGAVREVERLGIKFLEVTVPARQFNREFTILLSPSSIFRMRITSEAAARECFCSVPSEFRIEPPRPDRLSYEDATTRPPAAEAAMSIEAFFDSESELVCVVCGVEITQTSRELYAGKCVDCHAEMEPLR
jgi:hypothetical protein